MTRTTSAALPPRPTEVQAIIEALKPVADRQAGILHRQQFIEHGVTGNQILSWRARGWIESRLRWTYSFPGTGDSLATRAWSAMLSAGGDAAVSHIQALALLDVLPDRAGSLHCFRSDGQPRAQPGLIIHRTDSLDASDVVSVGGLRFLEFHRAVLSICGGGPVSDVDRALDRGVHLRLFAWPSFERLLSREKPGPARSALEAALGRLDANTGRKRSELERRLSELIAASDLPQPVANAIVAGFEVDNHWFLTRAIVEADGREYHSSPADIARDIAKQRALEALGYVLLRLTWHQVVYEPERTLERIRAFLLANSQPPVPRTSAE